MNSERLKEAMAKMTDEERQALAAKMDADLDEYMKKMESSSSKYMDGWSEENWEKEMEEHPFFTKSIQEGADLPPLLQGIQDLKYSPDENTPEELAKNYKEDGNFNFKCKKYRYAVASYSEGLKANCSDELLNAQLLTNRAAAQFHVGNFRSALIDCRLALKRLPNHVKALVRGAQCCQKLKRFQEGKEFCDKGLALDPKDPVFLELRSSLEHSQKELERNQRREQTLEKKKKQEEAKLLAEIQKRGIRLQRRKGADSDLSLDDLEPTHPAASRKAVHLDGNHLVWPVLFLYPEFGETDFIEAFEENHTFSDHLAMMFGSEAAPAPWDGEGKYRLQDLELCYETDDGSKLVRIRPEQTLNDVISDKRYLVKGGTPGFLIMVKGSKFHKDFTSKYDS